MRWLAVIALLCSQSALADSAAKPSERVSPVLGIAPASPTEAALADFLKKKYGKGGLFDVIGKVLDSGSNGPSSGLQSLEGAKADGSYWWLAYFAYQNVREYAGPNNSLKARCTSNVNPHPCQARGDEPNLLPHLLPRSGGDHRIRAFGINDQGRAAIGQQIGDDGRRSLTRACPGRWSANGGRCRNAVVRCPPLSHSASFH